MPNDDACSGSVGVKPFNVQPCRRDPVFHLVCDRWKLSPLVGALLFLVLGLGGNLAASALSGTFLPRPGLGLAFVQDRIALVIYPLIVPLGMFLALRFYRQTEVAFERLYVDGVIKAPPEEYNLFLRRLDGYYNSVALHLVALALALLVFGYLTAYNFADGVSAWLDWGMGPGSYYQLAMGLVVWYSAHLVLAKIVVTAWAIRRLFDWPVGTQPLHPDGCSGLRLLSDMAVTIALFVAVMGLGVVLVVLAGAILYGTPPAAEPVLIAVLLEMLTPLAFLSCLHRAHRAMRAERERMLDEVFRSFHVRFAQLRRQLVAGESADDLTDEILRLDGLHQFIQRLPVWPTNTQMLAQVFASVALPLGLLFVQLAIERLMAR